MGRRDGSLSPTREVPFELHAQSLPLPPDVGEYLRTKLSVKLEKFGDRVIDVVAHVKDANGHKGGVDKVCHLEAHLAAREPANVEERHQDLRAALDLAVDRLAEAVKRQFERRQGKRRSQERKIVRPSKGML